jgi:hypothetical protein
LPTVKRLAERPGQFVENPLLERDRCKPYLEPKSEAATDAGMAEKVEAKMEWWPQDEFNCTLCNDVRR